MTNLEPERTFHCWCASTAFDEPLIAKAIVHAEQHGDASAPMQRGDGAVPPHRFP
jgi:hypothetical protein